MKYALLLLLLYAPLVNAYDFGSREYAVWSPEYGHVGIITEYPDETLDFNSWYGGFEGRLQETDEGSFHLITPDGYQYGVTR